MKLESSYINNLEIIGSGTFGKIYKDGDKVYKLYKEEIKGEYYQLHSNPSLNYNPITRYKLNRLKQIKGKIKNCNLAYDSIYIDGKFSGVVADYFEGETLRKVKDELTFDEKLKISREIVETMKKLQKNGIYPLDLHLSNVMVGKDLEVRLVDLDDCLTKVRLIGTPLIRRHSIRRLKHTLQDLFDENKFSFYCDNEFDKYRFPKEPFQIKPTFRGIDEFLSYKEKKERVLFIEQSTDIDKIKTLGKDKKIILLYDEDNMPYFKQIILSLYEQGILIDEMIPKHLKETYIRDNNVIDYYDISNDSTRYVLLKK